MFFFMFFFIELAMFERHRQFGLQLSRRCLVGYNVMPITMSCLYSLCYNVMPITMSCLYSLCSFLSHFFLFFFFFCSPFSSSVVRVLIYDRPTRSARCYLSDCALTHSPPEGDTDLCIIDELSKQLILETWRFFLEEACI